MIRARQFARRPGIVLALALLLLASITASTISISIVISDALSQSHNVDDFIAASLAADSGLERSLAVVKAGRNESSIDTTVTAGSGALSLAQNATTADVAATKESGPLTVSSLQTGASIVFDILNTGGTLPKAIKVTADASATAGEMDVSWVVIDVNGNTDFVGRDFWTNGVYSPGKVLSLVDSVYTGVVGGNATRPFSGTAIGFRVKITAVNNPIANITIQAFENSTSVTPLDIPSRIGITSTGQLRSSRSQKQAFILWQLPSSRLFNFVLFTEGKILPQ